MAWLTIVQCSTFELPLYLQSLTDTIIKLKAALTLKTSKDETFHPDLVKAIMEVWRVMKVPHPSCRPKEHPPESIGQVMNTRAENILCGSQADVFTLRSIGCRTANPHALQ
jgi:hypothetical protein